MHNNAQGRNDIRARYGDCMPWSSIFYIIFCLFFCFSCIGFPHLAAAKTKTIQYQINIISPEEDETFQNAAQSIRVLLEIFPALAPGDTVVLYVDGKQATDPTHDTFIMLPWLERGTHVLQAIILQQDGTRTESGPVQFFQQRTSRILSPAFK